MSIIKRTDECDYKKGYTKVFNFHLTDKNLSFKEIGILTYIFSRPPHWRCSLKGFAAVHSDGFAAVKSAIKNLEHLGYVRRYQSRDEDGKLSEMVYEVFPSPEFNPYFQSDFSGDENLKNSPCAENRPTDETRIIEPFLPCAENRPTVNETEKTSFSAEKKCDDISEQNENFKSPFSPSPQVDFPCAENPRAEKPCAENRLTALYIAVPQDI